VKAWTVECAGGCGETAPVLREDLVWTCPPCAREQSVSPGWPAPDEPCDDDAECARSCYRDDDNGFVYEGTRGGNGDPEEDVQYQCWCEHHGVKR
jgi:hypothetical protein